MTLCHSGSLGELAGALAAAQGELSDAKKTSDNPHFRSKYADLAEVLQAARPVLSKHGLAVTQTIGPFAEGNPGKVPVTTLLLHKSGEWVHDTLYIPVSKADAQGVGAAITYGRRYALAAICGLAQEDDDGETAVGRGGGSKAGPAKVKAASKAEPVPSGDLAAEFDAAATADELKALAPKFAALTPEGQAKVLPSVKSARARLGL